MASMDDLLDTARAYRQLAIHKDNAHYAMTQALERRHKLLGVPVIVTTTLASTAIFSTLQTQTALAWKIVTGLVSLAGSVLRRCRRSSTTPIKRRDTRYQQGDIHESDDRSNFLPYNTAPIGPRRSTYRPRQAS